MKAHLTLIAATIAGCALPPLSLAQNFTADFPIENCTFVPWGGNDYFSLAVGKVLVIDTSACIAEGECDALETVTITVTEDTRDITFEHQGVARTVTTRVIEEFETEDDELTEISRNYYAMCRETRDVYYFGEEVDNFEDGEVVNNDGAWIAGIDGARPGIIFPQTFILGARYLQEDAPGIALDQAEHVGRGITIEVTAGSFSDCVEVFETTPLDPEEISEKIYCPGIGIVEDDDLELVDMTDPALNVDSPDALSGLWFDPTRDGEGFNVIIAEQAMVVYYFGFDADGERLWLVSDSLPVPAQFENEFSTTMFATDGGVFGAPVAGALEDWGTIGGRFNDCGNGVITLSGDDGDVTSTIVKLAGNGTADC